MPAPKEEKFTARQRDAVAAARCSREVGGAGLTASKVVQLAKDGELTDDAGALEPFAIGLSYVYSLGRREEARRRGRMGLAERMPVADALSDVVRRSTNALDQSLRRVERRNRKGSAAQDADDIRAIARAGLEVDKLRRAVHPQTGGAAKTGPKASDAGDDTTRLLAELERDAGSTGPLDQDHGEGEAAEQGSEATTPAQHDATTETADTRADDLPLSLARSGFSKVG